MFAKSITRSDAFLDMPPTARALYYQLGMEADDDGFINNPKIIERMVGASDDDMKLLDDKQYIISFDSGVIAIRHWKLNNYIQKDRYKETTCLKEKAQISEKNGVYTKCIQNVSKMYTDCIQNVYKMDTQVRLGKVRLGKVNIKESKRENDSDAGRPLGSLQEPLGSSQQSENSCEALGTSPLQQQPVEPLGSSQQPKSSKKFIKPTLKELEEYAKSINYESFDSNKFLDYYEAKGWLVGRSKMKDWKAAVRNWQRNGETYQKQSAVGTGRRYVSASIAVPEYLTRQSDGALPKKEPASSEMISEIRKMTEDMK